MMVFLCLLGCQQKLNLDTEQLYYVISIENNKAVLYPGYYEKELHDTQKDDFIEVNLADDIEFYDTSITKIVSADGKEDIETNTISITKENMLEAIEYDSAFVYIEYQNNEIIKMTLFGETTIYE